MISTSFHHYYPPLPEGLKAQFSREYSVGSTYRRQLWSLNNENSRGAWGIVYISMDGDIDLYHPWPESSFDVHETQVTLYKYLKENNILDIEPVELTYGPPRKKAIVKIRGLLIEFGQEYTTHIDRVKIREVEV